MLDEYRLQMYQWHEPRRSETGKFLQVMGGWLVKLNCVMTVFCGQGAHRLSRFIQTNSVTACRGNFIRTWRYLPSKFLSSKIAKQVLQDLLYTAMDGDTTTREKVVKKLS